MANKFKNASVKNALVGGIQTTQEIVELCAAEKIYPQIELFPVCCLCILDTYVFE